MKFLKHMNGPLRLVVWIYDQPLYHWIVSVPLAPLDTAFGFFYSVLNAIRPVRLWWKWQSRPEPHFPLPKTAHDVPVDPEACDACGKYLGTMIATYADEKCLTDLLPKYLELDPAEGQNGQHPLILLFGYTQDLRRAWWPLPGMSYLEFVIGIPNVRMKDVDGYQGPFFYIPQLRLRRFYPTFLGWLVGYKKIWSRMSAGDASYSIQTLLSGNQILDAQFTRMDSADAQVDLVDDNEELAHWQAFLNQPHLNPFGDETLFLHFHWDWKHTSIKPVDATLKLHQPIPGMAAGEYKYTGIKKGQWLSKSGVPPGAVRLCSPFELLAPFSRDKLRRWRWKQKMKLAAPPPRR